MNPQPNSNLFHWVAGALLLLLIGALTVLPFTALIVQVGQLPITAVLSDPWIQRVIRFSVFQAALSMLLSIGLAVPVAVALSREPRFLGRQTLLHVFSLSLVMPTLVAIFGIVAVYGRSGWLNTILSEFNLPSMPLYGLNGILIAHVFFNLPLATRIFLVSLEAIPAAHWRLAAQLGLRGYTQFKIVEWPAIRAQLIGSAILVFALCLTSFAIVLTLGGGPRATTIEVAIFQALRFDFDLGAAVTLALAQVVICIAVLMLGRIQQHSVPALFSSLTAAQAWRKQPRWRLLNAGIISLAAGFVLLPVLGLITAATNPAFIKVLTNPSTLNAFGNTIVVACAAASLSLIMAIGLLLIARHCHYRLHWQRSSQAIRLSGNIILVLPPLVLGTGLFVLLRPHADVFSLAIVLVVLINALVTLPFVLRILEAPLHHVAETQDRLVQSLGLTGWARFRIIDWPVLQKPAALAFGLAASLSAGDLGAIALFGSDRFTTLPLLLYQRIGSYRMQEAAVTGVLLLATCLVLFVFSHTVLKRGAPT